VPPAPRDVPPTPHDAARVRRNALPSWSHPFSNPERAA
jgi:hypothetical protein